ncbi:PREDICTED: telomere repeat-binding factor 2 [Fragaria vesca subsp. vesca]|uniref:telomere repeat-binding factor 2 n=1 Tax=Fragaria vesca subsp. vesca TaxID=101020 RepID=UPI0002C2EC29|nr:PREDICTED: telomere repeat-binding factor 2 [Fragaria vesca subsp. vesca]XP_011466138.1 PREDICTED: telomere repeat-binding factor 2 [Fragaria vesca subsp. vesca]
MGAPKQKWTPEEEAALKAGVLKHGAGKWRTILSDKEFGTILHLRSNVDLKDKWRNINVTAIWGSRQKAKLALKRTTPTPKRDNSPVAVTTAVKSNEETVDTKPDASSGGKVQTESKPPIARLDHLIYEALTNLKEPRGSDKNTITKYIEDQYWAPSNLSKLLSTKLKHMTANGKLVKVKHRFRIPPSSATSEKRRSSSTLLSEGKQKNSTRGDKTVLSILTKSQVDAELTMIRSMTAQEAAAAAAQAVAEAEAAIAAAEEAAREAEAAEAEAEAAQVFAKAAVKALKCRRLDLDMKLAHG